MLSLFINSDNYDTVTITDIFETIIDFYVQDGIAHHPIWKNYKFWERAILERVH